jgi:hypothetical protein
MLTIFEYIQKHGARATAKQLITQRVRRLSGLDLSDLPDSAEICAIVDNLEQQLKTDSANKDNIKEILTGIDADFLESLIYE